MVVMNCMGLYLILNSFILKLLADADPSFDKWNFGPKSFGFVGNNLNKKSFIPKEIDLKGRIPPQPDTGVKVLTNQELSLDSELPPPPTTKSLISATLLKNDEDDDVPETNSHIKSTFETPTHSSFSRAKNFDGFEDTTSNVLVTSTAIPTTTHSASSTQAVFARTTKGFDQTTFVSKVTVKTTSSTPKTTKS